MALLYSFIIAFVIYKLLDYFGFIDFLEEIIFGKFLHYDPIENDDKNCYNRYNR